MLLGQWVRSIAALSAFDRRTLRLSTLNYSEFPRCSNESYGARAMRITRAYVECTRSWLLGSSAVALNHLLLAHDCKYARSLASCARSQNPWARAH